MNNVVVNHFFSCRGWEKTRRKDERMVFFASASTCRACKIAHFASSSSSSLHFFFTVCVFPHLLRLLDRSRMSRFVVFFFFFSCSCCGLLFFVYVEGIFKGCNFLVFKWE